MTTFRNGDDKKQSFQAKIVKINEYKTLKEYLEKETVAKALPGVETLEEAIKIYSVWAPEKEVEKTGFLAFHIEVL